MFIDSVPCWVCVAHMCLQVFTRLSPDAIQKAQADRRGYIASNMHVESPAFLAFTCCWSEKNKVSSGNKQINEEAAGQATRNAFMHVQILCIFETTHS